MEKVETSHELVLREPNDARDLISDVAPRYQVKLIWLAKPGAIRWI